MPSRPKQPAAKRPRKRSLKGGFKEKLTLADSFPDVHTTTGEMSRWFVGYNEQNLVDTKAVDASKITGRVYVTGGDVNKITVSDAWTLPQLAAAVAGNDGMTADDAINAFKQFCEAKNSGALPAPLFVCNGQTFYEISVNGTPAYVRYADFKLT